MILVTGATGKTGSRVLDRLCAEGVPARALVRTVGSAGQVPDAAEVVLATFEDPLSLDAAVSGCTAVYLVSAPGPGQRRQEGAVIDAVRRAGAGAHVVKVAALGLGDPAGGRICVQHGLILDDLRASGLPWTVLALSQLMHNVFLYAAPVLAHAVLPVPAGDARVAWVDADDVAAAAVRVLTSVGHAGRTYDVTGPEPLHHDQVAALLSNVVGHEVRYVDVSPDAAVAAMESAGVDPWTATGLVETNAFYASGAAANPTDVVNRLTGRQPGTLAVFLERTSQIWATIAPPAVAHEPVSPHGDRTPHQ
jgi:uncharacterized protein YbjT (DUF2867 family)